MRIVHLPPCHGLDTRVYQPQPNQNISINPNHNNNASLHLFWSWHQRYRCSAVHLESVGKQRVIFWQAYHLLPLSFPPPTPACTMHQLIQDSNVIWSHHPALDFDDGIKKPFHCGGRPSKAIKTNSCLYRGTNPSKTALILCIPLITDTVLRMD